MFEHLDVISPQFVTALWFVSGIAILLALRALHNAHHRRFLRFTGLSLVCLLAIGLAAADTVNAHFAYLPTAGDVRAALNGDRQWLDVRQLPKVASTPHPEVAKTGATVRVHLPADPADGFDTTLAIAYLPPQYFSEPAARFPVIYLFHGSPGRPADWFHGGEAAEVGRRLAATGMPTILLAPQLSRSWTDDPECLNGAKEKVESHLLNQVIPTVDRTFRTEADRTGRIFAGMSAGGFCALNLGLRNQTVTATIIDMSGDTEPTYDGGVTKLFSGQPAARRQLVAANTPSLYAGHLPPTTAMRVWLDTGTGDKTIEDQMAAIAPVLRSRGLDVQWRVRSGGHTFYVWTAALQEAAPWAIGGTPGKPTHNPSHPGPLPKP